jgi:hypothetical protein
MNGNLKKTLLLFLFLGLSGAAMAGDPNLEDNFKKLDYAVAHHTEYLQKVQQNIDDLKATLATCTYSSDRYGICKHLYDLYLKFDSDSALAYAFRCQVLAKADGEKEEFMESKLDELMIKVLRGDYVSARGSMVKLGPIESFPEALKGKYAILSLEYYMRMLHANLADPSDALTSNREACWQTFGKYLPRNSWAYDYYEAGVTEHDIEGRLLKRLKTLPQPSIQVAMIEVSLASIYKRQGLTDKYYNALILSAINDISMGNREAQSLLYLIESPYVRRNLDRAYQYAMLCSENAKSYKDIWRSLDIVKAQTVITQSYEQALQRRNLYMMGIIALLAIALLAIFILFALLWQKRRKQSEMVKKQEGLNNTLHQMLERERKMQEQLAQNNQRMQDELKYRNANFINVYMMMSNYIAIVQKFKKNLYNLIVSGKIESARKTLKSNTETEEYMPDFYRHFDKAYLSTHPDFPSDSTPCCNPTSR